MNPEHRILELLDFLYGSQQAKALWPNLQSRLQRFRAHHPELQRVPPPAERLTERDAILITYADQFREPHRSPLQSLADFLQTHLGEALSGVHLLPFFPYSSDDGFAVMDYRRVDPAVGDWEDVARLGERYRLMLDAVVNHISSQSEWFQRYLRGEFPYRDYFIEVSPETDLSAVVRPRALPLLTPAETSRGRRYLWTTFSDDQIDLNYANPQVLLEIVDLLLFYVAQGAEIIRLDAIAYLWKEIGTSCIHLPQTHAVIKLFRAVLDIAAPGVILITETNVPHEENISYFGQEGDEAQMVYQFPLAPLVLHTFHTGDARTLSHWAASLETPSPSTTFFNFIASHDGIGLRPAEGLLAPQEIAALVERTLSHGGRVSYKSNPDGSRSPYELNITLYDALNDPHHPHLESDVQRFLASQAIMLSLAGVPGIYVHSLFGSRNCHECVRATGRARSINREKFERAALEAMLSEPASRAARVLSGYLHLLRQRQKHPAFHPNGGQQVLFCHPAVFALLRTSPQGDRPLICLHNVSNQAHEITIPLADLSLGRDAAFRDVLSGEKYRVERQDLVVPLIPYGIQWLAPLPLE